MKTEVVQLPNMRLAAVPHRGPYQGIGAAFGKLGEVAGQLGLFGLPGAFGIGVYLDDPQSVPAEDLRSYAGVLVSEGTDIGELEEMRIPGGKYLCASHIGSYSGLGESWGRVFSEEIPKSGLEFRPGMMFEIYRNDCADTPEEQLRTDIHVPVQ